MLHVISIITNNKISTEYAHKENRTVKPCQNKKKLNANEGSERENKEQKSCKTYRNK